MTSRIFKWEETTQLSIVGIVLAFMLPSAGGFVIFHLILPALVDAGNPVLLAYSYVGIAGLFSILAAGLLLMRREAAAMGITLTSRMAFKRLPLRRALIAAAIIVVGFILAIGASPLVVPLINAVGLTIPDYMPFFLNPTISPMAEMEVISPGLNLVGAYFLLPLFGVFLLFNILAEEFYFRAWILPKLAKYGRWSWVINGTMFALYHTFQLWWFPVLIVASLTFAFVFYWTRSVWPGLIGHLFFNVIITMLGLVSIIAS